MNIEEIEALWRNDMHATVPVEKWFIELCTGHLEPWWMFGGMEFLDMYPIDKDCY